MLQRSHVANELFTEGKSEADAVFILVIRVIVGDKILSDGFELFFTHSSARVLHNYAEIPFEIFDL